MDLVRLFPELRGTGWAVTSPPTPRYNCVAWAAGDTARWWWPDSGRDYYWPPGAPREETVEASVAAFALLGFARCPPPDGRLRPEVESVAVFANEGRPTQVARQLASGEWTSKCGQLEDITHHLDGMRGALYGRPAAFLQRPRTSGPR